MTVVDVVVGVFFYNVADVNVVVVVDVAVD